ncbi:UNVERIFIED_ORG: hypothetical protein GGI57_005431 [Rhizobium aethiopicum]
MSLFSGPEADRVDQQRPIGVVALSKTAESPASSGFFVGLAVPVRFSPARRHTSLTIEAERSNFRLSIRPILQASGLICSADITGTSGKCRR